MRKLLCGIVFMWGALAACGGGGNSTTTNQPAGGTTTVTGTAATGKPIANATITLRDGSGNTKTATSDANGKYTLDVSGLTPPYLLKVTTAGGTLYGVATQTGTANLHQFTNLIIRNWYKAQGKDLDTEYVKSGAVSVPTKTEVDTIEAAIRQIIGTWLQAKGVDITSFSLLNSAFDANGSGFDSVLDVLKVNISSGTMTIVPVDPTTGVQADPISTLPDSASLSASQLDAAKDGINQTLTSWKNTINSKGTGIAVADLLPLYAGATTYLNGGLTVSADIADTISSGNHPGTITTATVKEIVNYDAVSKVVTANITLNTANWGAVTHPLYFIYDSVSQKWLFYGDQRIAHVKALIGNGIVTLSVYDPTQSVTGATVSGPGLVGTQVLTYSNTNGQFRLTINFSPAALSVYTFTLTKSGGSSATYKVIASSQS
ncbi:carboxypeptidase-like regulatory domain-containing protein [Geobacter pickeringii]|uniref:Lipoprotein n=1 Tax=Geobacter pickeringii TaxID=345632 RepID=A0A0B5BGD2_9BACT|nr:carboxypeptidase-like regulatory domain-containing protein [Geobacter pickeringii]AJE04219.1 hypothetical protein GPICK_13425 [Geobacter pickeringii]